MGRVRRAWKALGDLDTILSWVERIGFRVALFISLFSAGVAVVFGVLDDLPLSSIFLLGIAGFGLVMILMLHLGRTTDQWLRERRSSRPTEPTKVDPREAGVWFNNQLRQGNDMRKALSNKTDYTVSSTLRDHIRNWGANIHTQLGVAFPGRASVFVDELPKRYGDYGRELPAMREEYLAYLNARLPELENLKKEWGF